MREKQGLTRRQLGKELGVSRNDIPAIEEGTRRAGPELQEQLVKFFGCLFEELFEVVLVDPESGAEKVLTPKVR
jgi:DNA-binding XRE family transcriptional regulator